MKETLATKLTLSRKMKLINIENRYEVSWKGAVFIYDIFLCKGNSFVCVIGHYDRLRNASDLVCILNSAHMSKAIIVDDRCHVNLDDRYYSPGEGGHVAIVLFPVPDDLMSSDTLIVSIRDQRTAYAENIKVSRISKKSNYLAVTAMFKDDREYLIEWIEYHRLLGVEHFYLYENYAKIQERTRRLLMSYLAKDIVTLISWGYPYNHPPIDDNQDWRYTQRAAINHSLYKYGEANKWMLFIDLDEYVYPTGLQNTSLLPLLEKYTKDDTIAALEMKMIWFGNSNHSNCFKMPNELTIKVFQRRATDLTVKRNKCFVRPEYIDIISVHYPTRIKEGKQILEVSHDVLRINHYYAMGLQYRIKDGKYNEVEDKGMDRFLPFLKHLPRRRDNSWIKKMMIEIYIRMGHRTPRKIFSRIINRIIRRIAKG